MTRSSRFYEVEIGRETWPRYDSLRFITRKSDIAVAVSVWLAKAHEIDKMAELNNVG